MKSCPKQLITTVRVNNSKDVTFQLDSGATCNLISLKVFLSILENPKVLYLKKTSATLKMYNGSTMYPLGKCTLGCTKREVSKDVDFFIKIMVSDIANSETVSSVNDKLQAPCGVLSKEWILKEYRDVFEGLGCLDGQYHMEVNEIVRPVVHPPERFLQP